MPIARVCFLEARTKEVMQEFGQTYKQQHAVALFNSVRFEIEGGAAPQSQLLHRKAGLVARAFNQDKVTPSLNTRCVFSFLWLHFTDKLC